ncbi:TPA: hypothetical protein I0I20_RS14435, partial [Enterococcus faecium]
TVKDQKLNLRQNLDGGSAQIHPGFGHKVYFSIKIDSPNGQSILNKSFEGYNWVSRKDLGTYDVPEGSTVVL